MGKRVHREVPVDIAEMTIWNHLYACLTVLASIMTSSVVTSFSNDTNDTTLIYVHIIWRHGHRAPISIYPTNMHRDRPWPNGLGELTERGMRQHFALGHSLFQRYFNCSPPFLSGDRQHKEIYVQSTDVNRTLTSAIVNLAGMFAYGKAGKDFPLEEDEPRWPGSWSPLPVHSTDMKFDQSGNPFRRCPRANELQLQAHDSSDFAQLIAEHKDFLEFLHNVTQVNVSNELQLYYLQDCFTIEISHNLTQPPWFTQEIADRVKHLWKKILGFKLGTANYFNGDEELIRLRGGAVLGAVVDKLQAKWRCFAQSNRTSECAWFNHLKYYALSAHDMTLMALFTALQCGDDELCDIPYPGFGSSVIFELYSVQEQPYIKILYLEDFAATPTVITDTVPGCEEFGDLCPLSVFLESRRDFIPVDLHHECVPKMVRAKRTAGQSTTKSFSDAELNRYFNGNEFDAL